MIRNIESVGDLYISKDYPGEKYHSNDEKNAPNNLINEVDYDDFSYLNPGYIFSEHVSEEYSKGEYSPFNCCFSYKIANFNDETCNPIYRDLSPECNDIVSPYCLTLDNVFTHCKKWCDKYPSLCREKKLEICNSNEFFEKNKLDCMQFCSDNKGECDIIMENTCENDTNLNDAEKIFCSCFDASLKYKYSPAICNNTCQEKGYKTKKMSDNLICPVQICNIEISNEVDVKNFDNNTILNNCGHPDRTKTTIAINPDINLFDNKIDDFRLSNLKIMIPLIFFIVFLFLGFFILLYFL